MSHPLQSPYSVCVVDIGSPKLGNIGWCVIDANTGEAQRGADLDALFPILATQLETRGLVLGLEAPLFVPLREDLMKATKARSGEGRRPWSAGAGAQVLAMNLPIMIYIFNHIARLMPAVQFVVQGEDFDARPGQVLVFEALVSGADKGLSHMEDAHIMAEYCASFAQRCVLPPTILEAEEGAEYFNLTAAALMHCGLVEDLEALQSASPIYKPS